MKISILQRISRSLRSISLSLVSALVASAALQGCMSDAANFVVSDNTIDPNEIIDPNSNGYLVFGEGLSITVEFEDENFNDDESGDYENATRSGDIGDLGDSVSSSDAPDDYLIIIKNDTTGEKVYEDSYANIKALTEPLVLPAAIYTIQARSRLTYLSPVWDAPEYESPVVTRVVADDKVVTIEELTCKLATIKTQVAVSADMMALFKTENLDSGDTPFAITLSYGGEHLEYVKEERRSGYFAPQVGHSTIDVELVGMYNVAEDGAVASYIPITWKQTISNVMGGQSRYITVKIDNYNSGKVQFKFEVQTWLYDAPLGVDITSGAFFELGTSESEIYDRDGETTDAFSPVVWLDGGLSVAQEYVVSQLMMDIPNRTYSPIYTLSVTPQGAAKLSLVELITRSTNESLLDDIETLGHHFNIIPAWSVSEGVSSLFDGYLGNVVYDSSTGVLSTTLRYDAIEFINGYKGSHEVVLRATDSSERVSHTSLRFLSIVAGGPEIVWRDGYSFDDTHEITAGAVDLPVVIDIESSTGISAMRMSIVSDVLTADELLSIGLEQNMDLINPGSCAEGLSVLGFPIADEVEGKRNLTLDITSFMPMLAGLGSGDSNFEITVGDGSGERQVVLKIRVL